MAEESMKDFEQEIEESLKNMNRIDDADAGKWEVFQAKLASKEVFDVKITEIVKGGCIAYVDEVRGFIPASKLSSAYVEDLNTFLNKHLDVVIITADPENKKLVLSHREIEQAKKDAAKAEAFANVKEGDVLTGKVETIKDYGVFVDLENGLSGLLHVSQISHQRVKNPEAVFKIGDEVEVKVIAIKDGKLSLSKKALEEAPHEITREKRGRREDNKEMAEYKQTGAVSTSLGSLLEGLDIK